MKKNCFNVSTGKKAYLYEEILPMVVSLIIIGVVLFTFSAQVNSAKDDYEQSAPTLKNQFPISFVQSFLYVELNSSQKQQLSIEPETVFYVKDLLQKKFEDDGPEKKIFQEIRTEYINAMEGAQLLEFYSKSSGAMSVGNYDNLLIRKEVTTLNSLSCLRDENYYFYLPYMEDISSKLVVILFSDSVACFQASQSIVDGKVF
jgi:hypothetical protein